CVDCWRPSARGSDDAVRIPVGADESRVDDSGATLRVAVDEVAVFFAATDHGRSVTNLAASEIQIRDNNQAPETILAFRNEAELPLRLGLIIDTSSSIADRFHFEQAAAAKFLGTVL